MVDTDILKNKGKGPIEATMVHDAESLQDNKGRIEHLGSYQEAVDSGKMMGDAS